MNKINKEKSKIKLNLEYKDNVLALYLAIITDCTVSKALSAMGISEVKR